MPGDTHLNPFERGKLRPASRTNHHPASNNAHLNADLKDVTNRNNRQRLGLLEGRFTSSDSDNIEDQTDHQPSALERPADAAEMDPSTPNATTQSHVSAPDRIHSMTEAERVWQKALAELALGMPPATYDTWMRDTQVLGYEDGEFIIGVPNAYACDWISNRLRSQIKRTLSRLLVRSVQVTLRVSTSPPMDLPDPASSPPPGTDALQAETNLPKTKTGAEQAYTQNQFQLDESDLQGKPSRVPQSAERAESTAASDDMIPKQSRQSNSNHVGAIALNANHTFESFIVGNHNRLAHAAATAISERPGDSFNPLFVYGGVGLGKTHLLHAIGNVARHKSFRVLYCTSEQFTNELILSIRSQSTESFRNKYRQVDILLIDDIQFIGGKESTQEEFFHTFNHLHAAGRQVVLSSDRPPKALATLEERLRSRFEGGLQTDISKPDFETRVAILQSKTAKTGMQIDQGVLMLIAERVDSNIRELEGALNHMVLHAKLFRNALDVSFAEAVLKNLMPERTLCTPASVIQIVAEYFQLSEEALKSRTRTKEIAHARQVAMYLLREENALSLPSIGEHLGGRDHSTIRHGVEKISNDIEHDEFVRHQIMALQERIYSAPGLDTG